MPTQTRLCSPGPDARSVRTLDGQILYPPAEWTLLPPGDPGLTRRVKLAGPTWTVQEKRGRKMFSRGVWARAATVATIRAALEAERAAPQYARRLAGAARRRGEDQAAYVEAFRESVLRFLAFHPAHAALGERLASLVTAHATPVGSGTVARTQRIPVAARAEAAVIAWLRHQTTAYDDMVIARVKGERRVVRRQLAARSTALLQAYRAGRAVDRRPLRKAVEAGVTA